MLDLIKKMGWLPCGKDPSLIDRFLVKPSKEALLGVFAKGYFRLFVYPDKVFCFYADIKQKSWSLINLVQRDSPSCNCVVMEEQLSIFQKLSNLAFEMKENFSLEEVSITLFSSQSDSRRRTVPVFATHRVYFEDDFEFGSSLEVKKACSPLRIGVSEDLDNHNLDISVPNLGHIHLPISENIEDYADIMELAKESEILSSHLQHMDSSNCDRIVHAAFMKRRTIGEFKRSLFEMLLNNLVRWKLLTEEEKVENIHRRELDPFAISVSFGMLSSSQKTTTTKVQLHNVRSSKIEDIAFSFEYAHSVDDIFDNKVIQGFDKVLQTKKTFLKSSREMFFNFANLHGIAPDIFQTPVYEYPYMSIRIFQSTSKAVPKKPKVDTNFAPLFSSPPSWYTTSNSSSWVGAGSSTYQIQSENARLRVADSSVTLPAYPPVYQASEDLTSNAMRRTMEELRRIDE